MVWQAYDRNEWAVALDRAVSGEASAPDTSGNDPFSLADPETVRGILASAGFTKVRFADVDAPVYYGQDVNAALDFVGRFGSVRDARRRVASTLAASANARLREVFEAHDSGRGVWFDSRAWIVTAERR
jgi:hypothetical protein